MPSQMEEEPGMCEAGGEPGLFFPLGGEWEQQLPRAAKVILYGGGLGFTFLGVGLIADVFMSSIETVTSKKRRVFDKRSQRYKTIKVWNETVANLTLMALGSSAPEILLNVVEIGRNEFFAGELGPGTIVGSAAFNLLCITAVCIVAIPDGEHRRVKDVTVYVVTAAFSIFAYLWLIFILMWSSKDVVTILEALTTLFMFPLLVGIAYAADRGWISGKAAMACRQDIPAVHLTKHELAAVIAGLRKEFGDLCDADLATLVEKRTAARPSKAVYRAERSKLKYVKMSPNGGCTADGAGYDCSEQTQESHSPMSTWRNRDISTVSHLPELERILPRPYQATLEFESSNFAVSEGAGQVVVHVLRDDNKANVVSCSYRTVDGTAKAGSDYVHCQGTLKFEVGETVQKIAVQIVDDDEWEQAEDFYIELFEERCDIGTVAFGGNKTATVTIIDDDDPGCLAFEKEFIQHDSDLEPTCCVKVARTSGCRGEISCSFRTEDDSAVAPLDYQALEGTLVLRDGQMDCTIELRINPRGRYDSLEHFRLILSDPVVCRFDANTDGDAEQNVCTIQLHASTCSKSVVDALAKTLAVNWDKSRLGSDNWKDQFVKTLYVGGSRESSQNAGKRDYAFYFVSFPWRVMCASIPPTDFAGGWCCFCVALAYIGFVTALIGELAELFGCALGVPNQITAITFVALGTSLPDTFASKTAAMEDPYADASITNITGSNSVNVFLGLGLPWTAAAIYWEVQGQTKDWQNENHPAHVFAAYPPCDGCQAVFVVKAASLGFSVSIFFICAVCALLALWLRRRLFKGELGGPWFPKVLSAGYLVFLWLVYVGASWIYLELNDS